MGLMECASIASLWKGYEYYQEKRIQECNELQNGCFSAHVKGSGDSVYDVYLDIEHPRKSTCNCPHANGKRVTCKHIIATYFTLKPVIAQKYYEDCLKAEKEEEEYQDKLYDKVIEYVEEMSKEDLKVTLLSLLFEGPEWQLDNFIRSNDLEDDYEF